MHGGVIAGGNFIVDYVKAVDVYPAEQALANIRREYSGSGGAPYNVLISLAKLGAGIPLRAIGRIGDDDAGRYILNDCRNHGIETSGLTIAHGQPTSYTDVMVVEGNGKRTFFHQRGANALLEPADFDFQGLEGWHFHYGYILLLDRMDAAEPEFGSGAAQVLARAKAAGLTTSIDLVSEDSDRFPLIVPPALKYADIAFMNEFEASRLSGLDFSKPDLDRVKGARTAFWSRFGFSGTLVVHWAEGAASCSPEGAVSWQGSVMLPKEAVKSAAGSGDAFAAGYLLGFLRDEPVDSCLRLGVCSAAACVTGFTCTDAVRSEAECQALGTRYGFDSRTPATS